MARWLLVHSRYAVTATTAPNTISGRPSTCRPHGTPGNGGSNWTMPSPATTRASAVRLQARKVRSLANVNRGSGSVPSSSGCFWSEPATAPPFAWIAAEIFSKKRWPRQGGMLIQSGAGGGPQPPGGPGSGGNQIPARPCARSGPAGGGQADGQPRVGVLVGDHRDHVQHRHFAVPGCPQPFEVCGLHPPGLAAEFAREADQQVVPIGTRRARAEGFGACPVRGLLGGDGSQQPALPLA